MVISRSSSNSKGNSRSNRERRLPKHREDGLKRRGSGGDSAGELISSGARGRLGSFTSSSRSVLPRTCGVLRLIADVADNRGVLRIIFLRSSRDNFAENRGDSGFPSRSGQTNITEHCGALRRRRIRADRLRGEISKSWLVKFPHIVINIYIYIYIERERDIDR